MRLLAVLLGVFLTQLALFQPVTAAPNAEDPFNAPIQRTTAGLVALYSFDDVEGTVVQDRSGVGRALNLRILDPKAVDRSAGALEVTGKTLIRSDGPAKKIIDPIRKSGEVTIESWIRPANTRLSGPARIVTISKHSTQRNFTLGQDGDQFDARLRTTKTNENGIPSLTSADKTLNTGLIHVVYTRTRSGRARLYVNGKVSNHRPVAGKLSNWQSSHPFALGNELSNDRPWQGTYYLVAVYSRALTTEEVQQNFAAGAEARPVPARLAQTSATRATRGLQVLYNFSTSDGPVIKDRSGVGKPIDLRIEDLESVRRSAGSLEVRGKTLIRSGKPATKIIQSVRRTGEISVEAWVKPKNTKQSGPARIVTLSANSNARNFTLGQDNDRFDVRFRTRATSNNGLPSVQSPSQSVVTSLTHIVYTRKRSGRVQLFINGSAEKASTKGELRNWNNKYELALANELGKGRPWLGTYYLVAIYDRSLSADEVQQNFQAGTDVSPPVQLARNQPSPAELAFQQQVAPLLAQHCLECHDSISKQGGLDLSRKSAALSGGDSGQVILPGNSAESLLWESVANDDMPSERTPLTRAQKEILKKWIDDGAVWSINAIDPAVYAHSQGQSHIWLQRLTIEEYIETVRSAVAVDIAKEARQILPPDLRADGFSNTAYNLNIDLAHVDAYSKLAETVVSRMDISAFARQFSKSRKLTDDSMRGLIEKMGKWVLRGPLEEHEIVSYRGISTTVASAGGDFDEAVRLVLQAMLQSPRFIYRIENQRGDGTSWPVGDYELASRLSYILWGGPPDRELMRAADDGRLDRVGVEQQVDRMLKDPRAIARSRQFIHDWLDLGRLDNLRPNPDKFPNWNPALAADMRNETLAFFEHVVWKEQRPLTALLNAQVTYVSPRLAEHYRIESKPINGQDGRELKQYDLSSERSRGGLLTHGSVLTIGGDEASMVTRGLFVLHDLLRGVIQDPPPCVDTTPVPTKAGLTQRGIAQQRIATAACGGCHSKFEPLAFGLEKFDGLGTFHDFDEHGNPLRDDGQIVFPDTGNKVNYETSAELMDLLAGSDRVRECLTWKVAQFALGRPLGPEDAPILEKIDQAAHNDGGTYSSMMKAILLSELVQETRTERFDEDASH